MRILCLQPSSIFETFGGIEYYLDDILQMAGEIQGHENIWTVIPQRTSHFNDLERPYGKTLVPFSRNPLTKRFENRFSPLLLKRCLETAKAFHPAFLLCGHAALGPIAFAVRKILKIPYFTVAYGIESWGNLWPQDEYCLNRADGIISISQWTERLLRGRGHSNIEVVHPALDPAFEEPYRATASADKTLRLLSVSRLDAGEQYKGQDHVLQALASLSQKDRNFNFHYTIQGDGTDLPRLQAMADRLGLSKKTTFLTKVTNRAELKEIYRKHNVYVMPSRFGRWNGKWRGEGFGIVYVEAAATGLPSIAYNCGGATDIIQDGVTGRLLRPDDITGLATCLQELHKNPENIQQMGKSAYDRTMNHFTRSAVRRELESAFRSLC